MSAYGKSWQCIWSASDEAIGGLQHATGVEGETILPIPSDSDTLLHRLRGAFDAPVRLLFNYVARPVLNSALWKQVRRHLQGNDVALAEVCHVAPWPIGFSIAHSPARWSKGS